MFRLKLPARANAVCAWIALLKRIVFMVDLNFQRV